MGIFFNLSRYFEVKKYVWRKQLRGKVFSWIDFLVSKVETESPLSVSNDWHHIKGSEAEVTNLFTGTCRF